MAKSMELFTLQFQEYVSRGAFKIDQPNINLPNANEEMNKLKKLINQNTKHNEIKLLHIFRYRKANFDFCG